MVLVPDKYVHLCEAGRGVTSRVYYCLPKHKVDFAKTAGPLAAGSLALDGLRRSIVAIKVSSMKVLAAREVQTLHAIRDCITLNASDMKRHFLDVKDVGQVAFPDLEGTYSYTTLDAIHPAVTLGDLLNECVDEVKIPIPFVYHFFLSMIPAVLFLRDEVQWAHNDLKEDNIMCRTHPDAPFNMPEFVIVDFGMAYDISAVKNDSGDVKLMLEMAMEMARNAEDSVNIQWLDFKRRVSGEKHRTRYQVDDEIGKIWEAWKGVAAEKRSQVTVAEKNKVKDLLEKAARKKGAVTNEMVINAVQN